MTPIQLATLIGNVLTQIDSKLADPQFHRAIRTGRLFSPSGSIWTTYSVL